MVPPQRPIQAPGQSDADHQRRPRIREALACFGRADHAVGALFAATAALVSEVVTRRSSGHGHCTDACQTRATGLPEDAENLVAAAITTRSSQSFHLDISICWIRSVSTSRDLQADLDHAKKKKKKTMKTATTKTKKTKRTTETMKTKMTIAR